MSLQILLTAPSYLLFMMWHGVGMILDSTFWVVGINACVSSVVGGSLHLELCCVDVPYFFLESPWRVKFYKHRDLCLGWKNSSRMASCKENPRLNAQPRRKGWLIAKELSCGRAVGPFSSLVFSLCSQAQDGVRLCSSWSLLMLSFLPFCFFFLIFQLGHKNHMFYTFLISND